MILQGPIQFVADNLIFIDFLAILMMKCKHYLFIFPLYYEILTPSRETIIR